ncbi:MAG: tripartite tricarboxylate transporter substrate-binding protein [Acetobacteraceae bacterium]|nr:tripartite tricarboxylate transporter substrate-binding protein [Acetobacteraceae bacterium]
MRRRHLLAAAPALLLGRSALAQGGWTPSRTVTIVVPFAAGGPTDLIGRLLAEVMGRELGQTVVVENVSGAGGTIAAGRVAQAKPDGHTLLIHHIGHAASATLYRRLPYDVQESFTPLGLVSETPMTIIARPDFPAEDLKGLLEEMRRKGTALNLSHSGLGGSNHLCGTLLQAAAGTAVTTVAFRGSAPANTELMAGRIDLACEQATNSVPFLREKRMKAYAVTAPRRVPGIEDVPTTAEAGLPGFEITVWHGLYGPRGLPQEITQRLSAAIQVAMRDEKLRNRYAELVTDVPAPEKVTSEYHRRFLAQEVARWRPLIQAAGQYAD